MTQWYERLTVLGGLVLGGLAVLLLGCQPDEGAVRGAVILEDGRCGVAVSSWSLETAEGSVRVPFDLVAPARGLVVVSAGASREDFEAYWDVRLSDDVAFVAGASPTEGARFTLRDRSDDILDGPTYASHSSSCVRRRGNSPAERFNAWHTSTLDEATPGESRLAGPHVRIAEICEVPSGASPEMAFVEIYVGGHPDACRSGAPESSEPVEPVEEPVDPGPCTADVDCVGHPDGPTCHPFAGFCGVDLSDYGVLQQNAARSRYFARPTVVPVGDTVVLSNAGSQAEFEAHWGPLGPDVTFASSGGFFPAIDGGESFTVVAPPLWSAIDGPTPPMVSGEVWSRGAPTAEWSDGAPSPGRCRDCAQEGVYLTEIGDAGDPRFEFVELFVGGW